MRDCSSLLLAVGLCVLVSGCGLGSADQEQGDESNPDSVRDTLDRKATSGLARSPSRFTALGRSVGKHEISANKWFRPSLGTGVDYAETQTFMQCVTAPIQTSVFPFAQRLYAERLIKDQRELNRHMNISAHLSAKGLWGSIGGSTAYFSLLDLDEQNLYWLVDAKYELMDSGIDTSSPDFHLTGAARDILNGPGGIRRFYEVCGTAFYSGFTKGAQYSLIYEFHSAEEKTMETVRAAANYAGFGVKAGTEFERLLKSAASSGSLDVKSYSSGGGADLKEYAASPEELKRELGVLRNNVYAANGGIPSSWFLTQYDKMPEVAHWKDAHPELAREAEGYLNLDREDFLASMYERYLEARAQDHYLANLQERSSGDEPYIQFSTDKLKQIQEYRDKLAGYQKQLEKRAKLCILGTLDGCSLAKHPMEWAPVPKQSLAFATPDKDFQTLNGWTLRIYPDPKRFRTLQLYGWLPGQLETLVDFRTNDQLFESAGLGVQALTAFAYGSTPIGDISLVRDPHGGQLRPNICVNETSDVCSLRIIERDGTSPGRPSDVKLQLTFFDESGFPADERFDFYTKPLQGERL